MAAIMQYWAGHYVLLLQFLLGLETLEHHRLIHDLILCYKYLHGLIDTENRNFWCVQLSPRSRNNGLKLYKAHCNIDVRKAFLTNRVVYILNSLPAAVVFSHNVSAFKSRLTEFNFCRFLHYTQMLLLLYLFIMVALCNRADHNVFILQFLSIFFFFLA